MDADAADDATAAVVARDLRKTYGDTVALDGVSLSVAPGEVFGLIGPNGAGKTTLVRALTGTTTPDEGTASLLGRRPTAIDRSHLGVLPQDFSPPARLSARELLDYYAALYTEARDPDRVLADVGLTDAADTWYENLSGGQQRRVCVGSTLLNDPDVLVLDEPTTGIDPAGRRTIHRLIEELAATGTTVLLTTHDMAEAERLADRVGLLAGGTLLDVGRPAELIDEHAGPNRLVVELADPETVDPDAPVLTDLSYAVDRRDGRLVVTDVEPTAIGTVAERLAAAGVAYDGLEWAEPTLEDVYHALADREGVPTAGADRSPAGRGAEPKQVPSESGGARS